MVNFTSQASSPIHLENTIGQLGKSELHINNRFDTFNKMSYDPVISASLNFLTSVMNRPYHIEYHKDCTSTERKVTDKLNKSLEQMQPYSKREVMNNFLTMLTYGCSLNEMVFKKDGGYTVFDNISPIHITTVRKFNMEKGRLKSVELVKPDNDSLINDTSLGEKTISGDKLLMICNNKTQDAPLGQSLLTGVWQPFKLKQVTEEYQLIGTAKQFGNILNISVPSNYINEWLSNPSSEEALYLQSLMDQAELLHAGKGSYILTPSDVYEPGGQSQFSVEPVSKSSNTDYEVNTTINRLNDSILISLQTSLLALGNQGAGSFALSESKTSLLTMVIRSVHETISDTFNKAIRTAFELNNLSTDRLPKLVFEDVEPVDFETVSKFWQRLVQSGAVNPDSNLESYLRGLGGAPEADYGEVFGMVNKLREKFDDNERIEKEG